MFNRAQPHSKPVAFFTSRRVRARGLQQAQLNIYPEDELPVGSGILIE